jgi:hypothetical protein
MIPTDFPQANCRFGPPQGMEESQVQTIRAFRSQVGIGSLEGADLIVTAWKPDATDLARLNAGAPLFLTFIGGLPPHMATTHFAEATNPA